MRAFQYSPATRGVLYGIAAIVYLFIFAPILIVIYASFDANQIFSFPYREASLRWYRALFQDSLFYSTIWNSLIVGVASGLGAVVVGGTAAYLVARMRVPGARLLHVTILAPLVISKVILGIAILLLMVRFGLPRGWLALIALHTMLCSPLAFLVIWARLQTTGRDYEEAALSLGADEIQTAFRITIPTMMPALIGGLLLAFTVSFDEFAATQFIATPITQTVPMQIYSMIMTGIEPTVNAFAAILIAITVIVPLIAQLLFGAFRRSLPRA